MSLSILDRTRSRTESAGNTRFIPYYFVNTLELKCALHKNSGTTAAAALPPLKRRDFHPSLFIISPFEVIYITTTNQPLVPNGLNVGHNGAVLTLTCVL